MAISRLGFINKSKASFILFTIKWLFWMAEVAAPSPPMTQMPKLYEMRP